MSKNPTAISLHKIRSAGTKEPHIGRGHKGINKQSDLESNLQIGPTDRGMVRIYVVGDGIEIPMDFDPSDAEEIAEEIMVAAKAARGLSGSSN